LCGVSFFAFIFLCLELWFECCDFLARFAVVWMVSVLDYGWVVSSCHRFNFLGIVFFCSSLVSATSSYVDDIAYIKIRRSETDGGCCHGRGVRCSFLSYGGTDFLLL
jgi:hypothetical protein